jgi:hypothetical protein
VRTRSNVQVSSIIKFIRVLQVSNNDVMIGASANVDRTRASLIPIIPILNLLIVVLNKLMIDRV